MLRRALLLLLCTVALACAARTPVPAIESKPHACRVQGIPADMRCATYPVWEDRERKAGRKIGLNIVIVPALGPERLPDALFILAGGPGQAATETAVGFSRSRLRDHGDIVLVDQRGTGGSNPLDCDFYGELPDLARMVRESFPLGAIRDCRERLSKIADLRLYTTAPAAPLAFVPASPVLPRASAISCTTMTAARSRRWCIAPPWVIWRRSSRRPSRLSWTFTASSPWE